MIDEDNIVGAGAESTQPQRSLFRHFPDAFAVASSRRLAGLRIVDVAARLRR